MKRSILLPTDFSNNAQNAIDYAIDLYKEDVCDFYILNCYSIEAFTMELSALRDREQSKQQSIAGLTVIQERLSVIDDSQQHQFHKVSECGILIEIMKTVIDTHDIDIVVMGTKGDTNSRTQIYGSQTVLAIEHIRTCPVLAIPEKAIFKEIKEIVFPTGYSTAYKKKELQHLVAMAKKTDATIRVLHVLNKYEQLNDDQLNKQNLLKNYFEGLEYSFHTIHHIDLQAALNAFIERRDIDMVAFINKKHNFLSSIFSKRRPMMKELGYYASIPILALHDLRH